MKKNNSKFEIKRVSNRYMNSKGPYMSWELTYVRVYVSRETELFTRTPNNVLIFANEKVELYARRVYKENYTPSVEQKKITFPLLGFHSLLNYITILHHL